MHYYSAVDQFRNKASRIHFFAELKTTPGICIMSSCIVLLMPLVKDLNLDSNVRILWIISLHSKSSGLECAQTAKSSDIKVGLRSNTDIC